MSENVISRKMLEFLDASPNAFFAVANLADMLTKAGAVRLYEGEKWSIKEGVKYFVTRNDSAIIAFEVPSKKFNGFQIMASHCDSPVFKIKANAEVEVEKNYVKLNVEKYGGMLLYPWFDRPLSVAGRVMVKTDSGIETRLVNIDKDLCIIPSLAIHMDREANNGHKLNVQSEMLPLFSEDGEDAKGSFLKLVAATAHVKEEDILDTDLFLYIREKGTFTGLNDEFVSSGRIDDLQCAFGSIQGFIGSKPTESTSVCCVFDNEEVGSGTKQGAASTFLKDTLRRIDLAFIEDKSEIEEDMTMKLASSFMVSADNAHAVHPSYTDKADPTNRPYLNKGIVIKYSANQKYTTDAVSGAIFKEICSRGKVPYQTFLNRSDMIGGSTLGNISNSQVALNTVDIGLPHLAMHSPYETAGARDTEYLVDAAKILFATSLVSRGDGNYVLK